MINALRNFLRTLLLPKVSVLLMVIGASVVLITINYYSFRIMSANRAYVNGESYYSKGQKKAVHQLVYYLYSDKESALKQFHESIAIPSGDNEARRLMEANGQDSLVKKALRTGRNHEDDLNDIVWAFKTFKSVPHMKKIIAEWQAGDSAIAQIKLIAHEILQKKQTGILTPEEQGVYLERIISASVKQDIHADRFSELVSENNRQTKTWLFYINVFFILIIVWNIAAYFLYTLNKHIKYEREIERKNEKLLVANKELDRFVYSASHELRSPITSLKGLIKIAHIEDDPKQLKEYIGLMSQSIERQDEYINEIIDYSKNKRQKVNIQSVNLVHLVDEIILGNQYIKGATEINFIRELSLTEINTDESRLKIILNSLISNGIKYADDNKHKKIISVKSYLKNNCYKIEISDNGIGIDEGYFDRIFDMFFRISNKGSGLGLYIAREAAENIGGTITVGSDAGAGSTFIVSVPTFYE